MPVLTNTRLNLLRYTTQAYIADDPTSISLRRKVRVPKPGGGHDKAPITLDPQIFRIINQTTSSGLEYSTTDGGETHQYSYTIVGAYDADIEIDDDWDEGDINYRIDGIMPNNGYETRAVVTAFAKEPLHG